MDHYACAILVDRGCVLLGKRASYRKSYPNCWDVIGGKVEEGETVDAALARELTEEIGVVPTAYRPLGVLEDPNVDARGLSTYHFFVVTSWNGGSPVLQDDEHSELKWFDIEAACALPDLAMSEYQALFRQI